MVFKATEALNPDDPMDIACGQCIGCKMKKAQDWAIRITHEAKYYEDNCFITLTFSNQELARRENPGTVDVNDVQKFLKRLRRHLDYRGENSKFRYFAVGEYGEKTGRPHYHILIFGWKPSDGTLWKTTRKQSRLYNSETLAKLWTHGHANFGTVTWDSAAYCAGYITKKFNDHNCPERLTWIDPITNKTREKDPEFATMSRRPGLGTRWIEEHHEEAFRDDYVIVKDKKRALPKFYDKWLEQHDPELLAELKDKRLEEYRKQPHITEDRRLDIHLCRWQHHIKRLREGTEDDATEHLYDLRQQGQSIPKAVLHAKRRYSYKDVT